MARQETLTDSQAEAKFDALDHGLWARYLDGDHINHAAWLRARAEGHHVGTCRRCGDYLLPLAPHEHSDGRLDYEAHCRRKLVATVVDGVRHVEGCGHTINAPGGRTLRRSAAHREMPPNWWEQRQRALAKPMEGAK